MQQNLARFFVLVALGACASEPAPAHRGTGSGSGSAGSDDGGGSDGMSQGSGSGSGMEMPPPPPGTLYGSVIDERGDTIDFSTGEPVHTHAGPSIDLGSGCPAVYKYAYFEDQTDPQFGRQTAINPLQWNVTSQVGSLNDSATQYRVRLDDGTVELDWTAAAAPDDNGLYTVRLYRNVVPAIGDHTGKMWVDVKFVDTQGNETVDSACWENHPMAAPLEIDAATTSDLFGWTLPAHSPISTAINDASLDSGSATEQVGASVYAQTFVQHTAEPVTLHLDHSAISGTASNTIVQLNIETTKRTEGATCEGVDGFECNPFPTAPAPTTWSGALSAVWDIHVVDTASGQIICHNPDAPNASSTAVDGCVIPARGASEAPHPYTIIYAMSSATSIAPQPGSPAHEVSIRNVLGRTYSLTASTTNIQGCLDSDVTECTELGEGVAALSLDTAQIDLAPFTAIVQTAPDSTASLESIASYATPSLSIGAQSWNAGDAGLD
jgi:hypothetical protein